MNENEFAADNAIIYCLRRPSPSCMHIHRVCLVEHISVLASALQRQSRIRGSKKNQPPAPCISVREEEREERKTVLINNATTILFYQVELKLFGATLNVPYMLLDGPRSIDRNKYIYIVPCTAVAVSSITYLLIEPSKQTWYDMGYFGFFWRGKKRKSCAMFKISVR